MGKRPKSSRKGKKAWRANISTDDIEDYFERSTKDALSGGSLADVPSDSIFFVDKSRDLSVKIKIEKSREKVLWCDSVLQRNPFVKPVPSSVQKKKKSKKTGKPVLIAKDKDAEDSLKVLNRSTGVGPDRLTRFPRACTARARHLSMHAPLRDWSKKNQPQFLRKSGQAGRIRGPDPRMPVQPKPNLPVQSFQDENVHDSGITDLWEERGEDNAKNKTKPKLTIIPAVEVEPPGCSFNPHPESHQDALARAVADEMQKIYQNELGPEPIPLIVPGDVIDEEDKYFLEADDGSDDGGQNESPADDEDAEKRTQKTKRITRVEINRRARRKEQLRVEAEAKKVEEISKEIDSLPDIMQEIEREDEERHKKHLRRIVAKQERLKARPPRLGKHKFEPAPMQVLLSEEKTGSLRQLKGCCTLVRDRFKSLEKRGLVVPSKKGSRK